MAKTVITNVGDPSAPKPTQTGAMDAGTWKDPASGQERNWFQVEVSTLRRGRKTSAVRNFWLENRDTLDRDAVVEMMEAGENLAEGEDAWAMVSVDIQPRPVVINGEPRLDKDGKPVFQTTANLIVLPGETIRQALTATFRGAKLLEDAVEDVAPDADSVDEVAAGSINETAGANV